MPSISTAPVVDVVQPRDEVGRRGLARARRPDERHELARAAPRSRCPRGRTAAAARRRPRELAARAGRHRHASSARPRGAAVVASSRPCRRPSAGRRRPRPRSSLGVAVAPRPRRRALDGRVGSGSGTRRRGSGRWPRDRRRVERRPRPGASTISGSISRYSKIRSNSASEPWISTWTLSSWPSGKNSRLWSVVNATIVAGASARVGSPDRRQRAGEPVHERRRDLEDRADDHEEPAPDHRLADLERGEPRVERRGTGRSPPPAGRRSSTAASR